MPPNSRPEDPRFRNDNELLNERPLQINHLPHFIQSHTPSMYVPVTSPPTPAPSPGPASQYSDPSNVYFHALLPFEANAHNPTFRRQYLSSLISTCTPSELIFISQTVAPLLKRDFFADLPVELALHILTFIDDPKTLVRAAQVNWRWRRLVREESVWKRMCSVLEFDDFEEAEAEWKRREYLREKRREGPQALQKSISQGTSSSSTTECRNNFSFRRHFRESFIVRTNWRRGGKLLNSHRLPVRSSSDNGTVTSLAMDTDWIVVGLSNATIQVYSAKTGVFARSLIGHGGGVWGVCLVSSGGQQAKHKAKHKQKYSKAAPGPGSSLSPKPSTSGPVSLVIALEHGRSMTPTEGPRNLLANADDEFPSHPTISTAPPTQSPHRRPGAQTRNRNSGRDRDGLHVMPSEPPGYIDIPRSMQIALGIDPNAFELEGDDSGSQGDSDDSSNLPDSGIWGEDAAEWHAQRNEGNSKARSRYASESEGGLDEEAKEALRPGGVQGMQEKPSKMCYSSRGWGQPNPIIVSCGCDKTVRVWDVVTGQCMYVLHGHTSTVRSLRVLDGRPIAVTGARDATLRVWDVQLGQCLRLLEGHTASVRCLDVFGNKVVSGSYDNTCRLWNTDTGECIHVLRGHFSQIYSVAFDGVRIASGGMDTSVRIWDAKTGQCTALLQGHTALVCQLQLSPTILATGGADGRVVTFSLTSYAVLHRIAAHDSSVTSLQFNAHFLVTGGNDGRVRLFETRTGNFVRELSEPSEGVWKAAFVRDTCAIMCRRAGKSVVEIWTLNPRGNLAARVQHRVSKKTEV